MKILWMFIILGIVSLLTLILVRKKMNIINILGCYLFSNVLITTTGVMINLNLKFTKQSPTNELIFWTQKIPEVSLKPVIIIWIVFILLFSKINMLFKVITVFISILLLVSIELFFNRIGYLAFVHWNALYSFLRYSFILSLMIPYSLYTEKLIKREMEGKVV